MKSRLKTMIAILLTVCFLASGCTTNPKSSQNSSTNSTNKTATEATESSSEKSSEDSENVPSEPLTIETPAGVVLVGKIKKDAKGWYFESEQPLNVKLTCYTDITPSYNNLTRIGMFDNSEDGTNKELYRDDTVTVTGMLQNFRGDMESLYFYPCKIEHGKTVKTGYAVPELDYPSAEPADYDPTAPLPSGMQPVVKNGHFEYNPYILTKNTLEYMGNDFAVFYKDFVDAWLSYKTSCPCKDKNYAEMFLSVMYYEFPLFTADGEYDFQNGYDEDTKTLSWSYKSKSKAEHDKLISDFTMAANNFLKQVKASDSEQLRAQAVYHAFCTSMTYDYEIMTTRERIDAYYAYTLRRGICVTFACAMAQLFAQVGVNATVASGETTSGGHVWNVVTINGNNYFCDSTFELSFNSGNGFVYFGMTLKDRLNDGSGFSESNMTIGSMNIKSVSEMALSEKNFANQITRFCSNLGGCNIQMKILTVANHIAILEELVKELSEIFPGSEIIAETDALMAGKYAFNHEVDIVFAEADMKRMNGLQLIHFVRQEHPGVLSYLIVPSGKINDFPFLTSDEVTGIIEDSFTKESLKKELAQRAK